MLPPLPAPSDPYLEYRGVSFPEFLDEVKTRIENYYLWEKATWIVRFQGRLQPVSSKLTHESEVKARHAARRWVRRLLSSAMYTMIDHRVVDSAAEFTGPRGAVSLDWAHGAKGRRWYDAVFDQWVAEGILRFEELSPALVQEVTNG